ncbi:hypothetical protein [Modestobacter sp. Leaf380]|uniref:maltokinase N-terminal cap-like domain-containing protein n=1 Tax=Modestobacter sp. Leaf380 TaxID=1736356 RepID=UPI0006F6AF8B|nr:hypothetical protein [Modestobacter sp. Leaf380]KQS67066.1 hypothetical protein ASG41_11180 [Modestobacter sp. Leaf380]
MAVIHAATLVPGKLELLQAWVPTRPWAAGLTTASLEVAGAYRFDDPAGEVGTETFLLRAGDAVLHVPVTYRAQPLEGAGLLGTTEHSVLGTRWVYDGPTDPVYAAALAAALLTGTPQAELEHQTPDGPELREPTARVHADGALGTLSPPPADVVVSATDQGTTTLLDTGGAELVLLRVLGGPAEGTVSGPVLRGTWAGQDTPALLAFAR